VISHIHGAAHCGWQDAQFITIGRPLGASIEHPSPESVNRYVWDPNGVIAGVTAARIIDSAEMPATATWTGFSHGDSEMWIDSADESVLYIVDGTDVAVWERDFDTGLCS